jgi:hypothetical protein
MENAVMYGVFLPWQQLITQNYTNFGRTHMERHPNDLTTDEEIDAAFERAKFFDNEPLLVEATFRPEPGLNCLILKLSDGRRLLVPREDLDELDGATDEQAKEIILVPTRTGLWWPQLDTGIELSHFLEYRWGKPKAEPSANLIAA